MNTNVKEYVLILVMNDEIAYYVYHPADGRRNVLVRLEQDSVWLTAHQMAELFRVEVDAVRAGLESFLAQPENDPDWFVLSHTFTKRQQGETKTITAVFHRLECIHAVGRVLNPAVAERFKLWAWSKLHPGSVEPELEEQVQSYDETAWLDDWQQAPKEAVLHSDDPKVWRILACYWLQEPVDFIYHGGSESGTPRRIVPMEIFQAEGYRSIWFRGYCELRQGERTFNLHRVEFLPMRDDFVVY